jgi:hypothetical protein
MDKAEAREMALAKIRDLREMTWQELRERYLRSSETEEVEAPSGTTYQRETSAVWDGEKEGNLRLFVAVDDGGWRAFAPLSESFIIAPDGSFVDE